MPQYDTVIGLDIGSHTICAAWVRRTSGKPLVTRTESLALPQDATVAKSLVGPWAERVGLRKHPCVIGISSQQTMFQPFSLPPGDPRTEEQAAAMEVVKFNEMASETMLFDQASFKLTPDERRILVAMARPSVVDNALKFAENLELNVIDVIPTCVGLFNLLEAAVTRHDAPFIYANIGGSGTELAIGSASIGMMFARSFSSGGQTFTDALAAAKNMPRTRAEVEKIDHGCVTQDEPPAEPDETSKPKLALKSATPPVNLPAIDGTVVSPLRRAADLWVSEMQSSLSVYRSLFSDAATRPARIVLAGGGSLLAGFAEYIAEKLQIETVCAEGIKGLKGAKDHALYAAAAGLALTVQRAQVVRISLLPERLRDELSFKQQKPYWISAGVVAGLILAVSLVGGYRDSLKMERHLSVQDASLNRRKALVDEIETIEAGSQLMRDMSRPLSALLRAAPLMRDLITLVAECKDKNDQITMVCDEASYFGNAPLRPPEDAAATYSRRRRTGPDLEAETRKLAVCERVLVEGITLQRDLTTVKALIAALKTADFVKSADLLSDDQLVETPGRRITKGRLFVIDVRMKP